jgi:glycosyltransferase involved in cell wall biosynthesis
MNISFFIESLDLRLGGPSHSIPLLVNHLHQAGVSVSITRASAFSEKNNLLLPSISLYEFKEPQRLSPSTFRPDIIHANGIWTKYCHQTAIFAHRQNAPFVLAPRGMLETWALQHNAWKKRLAWLLYQKRDLQKVTAFHATASSEAESIRRLGFKQPIAVIPNGVDPLLNPPQRSIKASSAPRKALFLSRLHPKKGIPFLLHAWAALKPAHWELLIVGNDESQHQNQLEALTDSLGIRDSVRFPGPVYGEEKDRVFREADLFILPTYSENFGIVVAESLQYGIPVITTTGTPWQELQQYDCGWWVEPTQEGITSALKEALHTPSETLIQMGINGQNLIRQKYLWPDIAKNMILFYQWLLGKGERPTFVV